jgi:signal transduction histidine kinase
MDEPELGDALASRLVRFRDEILTDWTARLRGTAGSHYAERPEAEVFSWAAQGFDALVEGLAAASPGPLEAHARAVTESRHRLGFAIDEVVGGLLLLKDAALSHLHLEQVSPASAVAMASRLDWALRLLVAHFARIFAAAMREQQQRVAVLEERQRLARDLHDSVSPARYGVTMYAEATARLLQAGQTAKAEEHVRELRASAREAMRDMRLVIFELQPPALEQEGLVAALQGRLAAVEARAGLETELTSDLVDRLPRRFEEGLHGIAQEALNNTLRHARATRIAVRLRRSDTRLVLEVIDNGTGFEVDAAGEKGGFGLHGMRERAAALGAELDIVTGPGAGTRVTVSLALPCSAAG